MSFKKKKDCAGNFASATQHLLRWGSFNAWGSAGFCGSGQGSPVVRCCHPLPVAQGKPCPRNLGEELAKILKEVVEIVNFVKSRALNTRLFAELSQETGAEYEMLLYHSTVRWLTRGKVTRRLLDLRTQVEVMLREKKNPLVEKFSDNHWLLQVAYLTDIFSALNSLNVSMQGRNHCIISLQEKLLAFREKTKLWTTKFERGRKHWETSFPTVSELSKELNVEGDDIQELVDRHLSKRQTNSTDTYRNWMG